MNKSISKIFPDELLCVMCHNTIGETKFHNEYIECTHCHQKYPVINGIPVILNESESIFSFSDFLSQKNLFFDISSKGQILALIGKILPSIGGNNLGKKNFNYIENHLLNNKPELKPKVLIIGGSIMGDGMSDFAHSKNLHIIESDVSFGPRTKIIFDSHSIPYANEVFDCVVVQAVLEHVIDPVKCVSEIHRVLKPNGIVYAETPFMQQVHGGPYDFTRYTRSGHRKLFQYFTEIKSGMTAGSGTALAWCYQYFLLSLFGYTNVLRMLIKFFSRITGFWMKYFDYISRYNERDTDGASGFYFIGKKGVTPLSDKELIRYFSQGSNK